MSPGIGDDINNGCSEDYLALTIIPTPLPCHVDLPRRYMQNRAIVPLTVVPARIDGLLEVHPGDIVFIGFGDPDRTNWRRPYMWKIE